MASNPFGIVQVDVPGLLQTYEGVKRSRLEDMYRQRQYERQERADERQIKLDRRADDEYERGSKAREAIARGAKPEEVIAIDPALGFDFAKHSASLAKEKAVEAATRADSVGSAALYLSELPENQMKAQWAPVIDKLAGMGYTDLAQYRNAPDRNALGPIIAASKDAVKAYLQGREAEQRLEISRGQLGVSQGNLNLAREREARVNRWGPQPLIGMVGSIPGGSRNQNDTSDLDY